MKTQKPNEIETELNKATKRLDELAEMRDGITAHLGILQKKFIDGAISLDELQSEQSKLTVLNESIKALESKQNELRDAFQRAGLSESRRAKLEIMKTVAGEAETAFNEYVELRGKFAETIQREGEKMVDALFAFRGKQGEFSEHLREVAPTESTEVGLSGSAFGLATATHLPKLPDVAFPAVLSLAERIIGTIKTEKEQAVRRAARAAEQLKIEGARETARQEKMAERARQLEVEQKRIATYRAKNKMPIFSPADLALAARESLEAL